MRKMDNSSGDVYKDTIDYIKKIEREIESSFESNSLRQLSDPNSAQTSAKDRLVEKFSRDLVVNEPDAATASGQPPAPPQRRPKSPRKSPTVDGGQQQQQQQQQQLNQSSSPYHSSILKKNSNASNHSKTPSPQPPLSLSGESATGEENETVGELPTSSSISSRSIGSLNVDKESNYRYSFYDNSNQLSIFLAHSSLIQKVITSKPTNDNTTLSNKSTTSTAAAAATGKVFGCHPNSIQRQYHGHILPPFFEDALFYLTKFGLNSVGIFRKSGVKSRINSMRDQIEAGRPLDFASVCVFDVADLVKSWLRELRPHLITKEMVANFTASRDTFSLVALPDSHRYLLWVVLKFLGQIAACSRQNQMTVQNIAICFTPSLCECETEQQIVAAQRCLEHCIQQHEQLFCITLGPSLYDTPVVLNRHVAQGVFVSASPRDILNRILYERNVLDPLIAELSLKSQAKNADTLEISYKFSFLLPQKTFLLRRTWSIDNKLNSISLNELADLYKSVWRLSVKGQGHTEVTHQLELDFRGFSQSWYDTIFAPMHDRQLQRLAESFQTTPSSSSSLSSASTAGSSTTSTTTTNPLLVSDL